MQTAASVALPLVGALIERAQHKTGSRMLAYESVARAIGSTSSWVRKFAGNQPVRLDADTFLRIGETYRASCARWDAEADNDRAVFFALGGGNNAMATSANTRPDVAASTFTSAGGEATSVVASVVDEVNK